MLVPRTPLTARRCVIAVAAWLWRRWGTHEHMYTLLWLVAAVLVITGIVGIVRGALVWGIALIVAGLLIGPGGVSILS